MLLVGVSGGSGSGKTTLAAKLQKHWGEDSSTLILQDSYYIDKSAQFTGDGSVNFDHPHALDWELMIKHLTLLKQGMPVDVPIYEFETHKRSLDTITVKPKQYVVVDGILIYHPEKLRNLFDHKIFVDCPEPIRFERRLKRDMEERGRTRDGVKAQYQSTVLPMHNEFVEPTKAFADEVVDGENGIQDYQLKM